MLLLDSCTFILFTIFSPTVLLPNGTLVVFGNSGQVAAIAKAGNVYVFVVLQIPLYKLGFAKARCSVNINILLCRFRGFQFSECRCRFDKNIQCFFTPYLCVYRQEISEKFISSPSMVKLTKSVILKSPYISSILKLYKYSPSGSRSKYACGSLSKTYSVPYQ